MAGDDGAVQRPPHRLPGHAVSTRRKSVSLSREEVRALDRLAETYDFWSRIRAAYIEFDALTERQYEIFMRQIDRDSWKASAQRVHGVAIRNKFRTEGGKPRCAHRGKPYCQNEAVQVVGTYAYCLEHLEEAKESLEDWRAAREAEKRQDAAANESQEAAKAASMSRLAAYFSEGDGGGEEGVPF